MSKNKIKFIDSHYMVGTDYWLEKNKPKLEHTEKLDEFNKVISLGYEGHALIYPFPSSEDEKYSKENQIVNDIASKNKNVIPVFALNTNFKECFLEVEKYISNFKKAGIVIWPILCKINLDELAENKEFINFCNKHDFFIYIHVGAGNEKDIKRVDKMGKYEPIDAVELAKKISNKKFILGHLLRLSNKSLEIASKLDNVIIETSGISSHGKWYENGQNVFPAYDSGKLKNLDSNMSLKYLINIMKLEDKLTFGSSYPYSMWWKYDLEDEINLINKLDIDYKVKEKILYKNIIKFLDLGG